jgi:hypothetical protein
LQELKKKIRPLFFFFLRKRKGPWVQKKKKESFFFCEPQICNANLGSQIAKRFAEEKAFRRKRNETEEKEKTNSWRNNDSRIPFVQEPFFFLKKENPQIPQGIWGTQITSVI